MLKNHYSAIELSLHTTVNLFSLLLINYYMYIKVYPISSTVRESIGFVNQVVLLI